MTDDLQAYLRQKQELVEQRLRQILEEATDCPESLVQAMCYSLLARGKRLRPKLVILAAEACGGTDRNALAAACAVEMIHLFVDS